MMSLFKIDGEMTEIFPLPFTRVLLKKYIYLYERNVWQKKKKNEKKDE